MSQYRIRINLIPVIPQERKPLLDRLETLFRTEPDFSISTSESNNQSKYFVTFENKYNSIFDANNQIKKILEGVSNVWFTVLKKKIEPVRHTLSEGREAI